MDLHGLQVHLVPLVHQVPLLPQDPLVHHLVKMDPQDLLRVPHLVKTDLQDP